MAANVTTTGGPATLLRNYFQSQLMLALQKELIWKDLCDNEVIPANSGKTIEFHRINNFAIQPTGVTEDFGSYVISGILKARTFTIDAIPATLIQFGNDLEISEFALMTTEPNPLPDLTKKFLYNAAETIDFVAGAAMTGNSALAGTGGYTWSSTVPSANYNGASVSVSVVWGDGSATLTEATLDADITSHLISAESFNKAYVTLKSRGVKPHPKTPGRFASIISPGQAGNLRLDSTFMEIAERGFNKGENKFESATIGDVFGCRVMESALTPFAAGTIDSTNDQIYRGVVIGEDYCKAVSHAKGAGTPKIAFIPPSPSAADPYGNMGYLSWKMYGAFQVTNTYGGVILKTVSTNKASASDADDVAAV